MWASFFGSELAKKYTRLVSGFFYTGDSSEREAKEYRVYPDTIKELGFGSCIYSYKNHGELKALKIPFAHPEKLVGKRPKRRGVYRDPKQKDFNSGDASAIQKGRFSETVDARSNHNLSYS